MASVHNISLSILLPGMRKAAVSTLIVLMSTLLGFAQDYSYPAGSPSDSLYLVGAQWHWTDLGDGVQAGWTQVHMFSSVQSISIIRFPSRKFRTVVVNEDGDRAATTSEMASRNGGIVAINGSYFTSKRTPSTFVKDDGKVISSTSDAEGFRVNGLLLLKREKGRTRMDIMTSLPSQNEDNAAESFEAVSSGPMLVEDGERLFDEDEASSSFYGGRHPRSFVGYTLPGVAPKGNLAMHDSRGGIILPKGPMVYFVVVDGRFPGQADGTSIPETAFIARILGLQDAVNFDGGGSSTLWSSKLGVINHPYDNKVYDHEGERKIPNILMVVPK